MIDAGEASAESLTGERGADFARGLRRRWAVIEVAASVGGAAVVVAFLHAFHAAEDVSHSGHDALRGSLEVLAYLALVLPLGWAWRERRTRAMWRWLCDGRAPSSIERDLVLRAPLRELAVPAALWVGAAVLFAALQLSDHPDYAPTIALSIALGGVTTCALIYLSVERLLRPMTARALALRPPEQPLGPGVSTRVISAWIVASGVPMLGLALIAVTALAGSVQDPDALAIAILILAVAGLGAGAAAIVLSARALADSVAGVRRGLGRVRAGRFDTRVEVDDAGELGLLQVGFNEMAKGLHERERLRDLFGRHVGEDVARRALAEGAPLGGELREVAALFIDIVGSTALAARRPPQEVVSTLNRFFTVVVDVAAECGGWVNRFEGDGALCVFGAPTEQPDAAGSALAAGRRLRERLADEMPELEIGIGISAGHAVAGNVGATRRLEYTLIGDPVNEAARLCELAKREKVPVLASAAALARAGPDEAARWRLGDETVLRGRTASTRLATPTADHASPERAGAHHV